MNASQRCLVVILMPTAVTPLAHLLAVASLVLKAMACDVEVNTDKQPDNHSKPCKLVLKSFVTKKYFFIHSRQLVQWFHM